MLVVDDTGVIVIGLPEIIGEEVVKIAAFAGVVWVNDDCAGCGDFIKTLNFGFLDDGASGCNNKEKLERIGT